MFKLLKKHLKNEKGLTLIELLVVIVILGIIAAIAVVSIGGIIGKTKEKAQVTEAVQIINAAKLAQSTEGKYPSTGWTSTTAADNPLKEYVSNLKDTTWTVTWTKADGYSITNHQATPIITGGAAVAVDAATTAVTEKALADFLGGDAPPATTGTGTGGTK
jgi:type IV pilus assembly protein PilA